MTDVTTGFSAHQFETIVRNYYEEKNAHIGPNDDGFEGDLLFSNAPPAKKTTVDDQLLESVFDWLCHHPDIDIEDVDNSQDQVQSQPSPSILDSKLPGKRITTSEDRIWQAIAGHGIDNKRIPPLEFDILMVIAAHGARGVLQPRVVNLTGQDKRSVPKRTDALAEKGYIIKESVLGSGSRTSSLKLKRYADEQRGPSFQLTASQTGESTSKPTLIYYDVWFNTTMRLLKENDNIIYMEDLRMHLGLDPKRPNKLLRQCLRRIEETGCISRMSATLHDADGNVLHYAASGREMKAPAIQLLREPTEYDRIKFPRGDPRARLLNDDFNRDNAEDMEVDMVGEEDEEDQQEDEEMQTEADDDLDDLDLLQQRVPPQWTPDVPIANLVYKLVQDSGTQGTNTTELANRLTGPAWRRPLDQVLTLLTDAWEHSQPPHLRHLGIVRDTGVHGYQFKSYDNFQKAVDAGQATWEAVRGSVKSKGKSKAVDPQPALDEWGFPLIPLKELEGHDRRVASSLDRRSEHIEPASDIDRVDVQNAVEESTSGGQQQDEEHTHYETPTKMPAATSGVKRRRPYTRREDPSRPGVPLIRKREIPQREIDEWEAASEIAAQRRVMFELHAEKMLAVEEADGNREPSPVAADDLPEDRVERAREEILTREKPGIYINPPGARSMKQENFVSRGRPRKALIAVIKTGSLHGLEWFRNENAPRFAPASTRRRTAKTGIIAAVPKSPEFVDSDSEQDEPAPKKQRLSAARPEHEEGAEEELPFAGTAPGMSSSVLAQDARVSFDTTTAHPVTSDTSLQRTPKKNKQRRYKFAPAGQPNGVANSVAPEPGSSGTASSILSAEEQLKALRSKRGRKSQKDVALRAELEAQIQGDISKAKEQSKASEPQPTQHPHDSSARPSHGEFTEPSRMQQTKENMTSAATQEKSADPQPAQQLSKRAAASGHGKAAEPKRKTASTEDRPVKVDTATAQAHPTHADAAQELKALRSKPGRKSLSDLARIAELQEQIASQQRPGTTENTSVIAKPAAPSKQQAQSNAVEEWNALRSRPGRKKQETIRRMAELEKQIKEESNAGSTDMRQIAKPSNASDSAQATVNPEKSKQPPSQTNAPPTQSVAPKPLIGSSSFTASNGVFIELFDKAYVEAHPEETFHHRGQGRYARGPRPPKASISTQSARNLFGQSATTAQAPQVDVIATKNDGAQHNKQPAPESTVEGDQPATFGLDADDRAEETGDTDTQQSPVTQQQTPIEQLSFEYVLQHPDETFHHRGRGTWARGLPPSGSSVKTGVRGPGADAWKESMGTSSKALKPLVQKPTTPASTEASRRSNRRSRPTDNSISNNGVAARLMVKLHLPRPYLATFGLDSSAHPNTLGSAQKVAPLPQETSLPTPPQDHDTGLGVTGEPVTPNVQQSETTGHSSATLGSRNATASSSLMIIKPYSAPIQQAATPQIPNPSTVDYAVPSFAVAQDEDFVPPTDDEMDVDEPTILDRSFAVTPATAVEVAGGSPKALKKSGLARGAGNIVVQRRNIILDTLRGCGGVFPGNVEIWFAFATAWQRLYNQTPDKRTVDNVVKSLLQSQEVKKLQFQFHGKQGQVVERAILAEPNVDPNSTAVQEMQKKIVERYPLNYLPPEVGLESHYKRKESLRAETEGDDSATPVTIRQTQEVTAVEMEAARQQGFSNIFAYRQHLVDEATPKRTKSLVKSNAKRREKAAWEDQDFNPLAEISKDAAVRRLPRKVPPLHRKPLSSLRPTTREKNRVRHIRDVEGGMTLEDGARHRLRAAHLMYRPAQAFHEASGTFNTSPVVPLENASELRTLRNRAVVLDKDERHSLVKASSNVPHDLADLLTRSRNPGHADKKNEFYDEIDAVMAWEEQQQEQTEVAAGNGLVFINHTLNQPHVYTEPSQGLQASTLPVPSSVRSLGAQSLMTPEMSKTTGKPKRQYASRKSKAVSFDDGAQDSDSDYVPGLASPDRRPTKIRADGKEIIGRDRKSGAEFKDVQRLIVAVALVTTLCGGVRPDRFPWNVVAHAMGFRYDAQFYRRRWDHFKRYRQHEVDNLRKHVRDTLPAAYERDELPRIDFQTLSNTDWPSLVGWVEETVLPSVAHPERPEIPDLLQSREAIEEQFVVEEQAPTFRFNADEYFTNTTDMGRKHYALRYTHGIPLPGSNTDEPDDMMVLKSWIRAISTTKQWNFNPEAAAAKIRGSFSSRILEKLTAEMVESRMLSQERKGRQLPGRNYVIHGDILAQFRRWPAKPEEHLYLRQVASAWAGINKHFETHDQLELVAEASDQEYMALTNMVSQGQIKALAMLPPRKDEFDAPFPKLSPWGYGGANYETKKVNPSVLKAPVVYVKTPIYQSHHGLKGNVPIPLQPPLRPGEKGLRVPFWVDIHGNLIEDVWDMVVRSVMNLIVFRSGSTASRMEESHNHKFWDWEIELVLDWMEKTGIATRCGAGGEKYGIWQGGWTTGEWWYCAFTPDVAVWQAPSGAEIGVETVG